MCYKQVISNKSSVNPLTATSDARIKFPRLPRACIYAREEESLYNRLLVGHYKSVAYQAVSISLPKGVVVVLYIGFQFGTKNIHWVPKHGPQS